MKRLLSFVMAIIFAMQLWAQSTVVLVGDTTATTEAKYVPANTFYKNSYTQSLYPAAQIQPGLITSISYYHTAQAYNVGNVAIYMKEVTETTLPTTFSPTEEQKPTPAISAEAARNNSFFIVTSFFKLNI
jgi:hypothetical protein